MSTEAMHVLVTGHVQGVAFRWSTRDRARALGLTGWVRNLTDGRVEVLASGSEANLEVLYDWLAEGSSASDVEDRERSQRLAENLSEFDLATTSRSALR